jgi:uncharacterized membrane protein YkvI
MFRIIFQTMIFAALLESGTGQVHAINERIAHTYRASRRRELPHGARLAITIAILLGSIFVADRIGLISLIADGYRWLAYIILAVYVLPLLTIGIWQLRRGASAQSMPSTQATSIEAASKTTAGHNS